MKKTLMKASAAAASAIVAFSFVPAAFTHPGDTSDASAKPSWEEFKSQTYQDADGQYIVDGDVPISNEQELRKFYDSVDKAPGKGDLIVNTEGGNMTLWSKEQARDLTYCVSDNFGSKKQDVVRAMAGGAATWENAAPGVDFKYVPAQDGNCNTANNNVVFSVEPSNSTSYIARAFFPNSPKSQRNVLVTSQLTTSGWSPNSIMAHELGHTLGFRHEHTRPEAGKCFEDNNWQPLTPYDSASIMHYPQCNGSSEDLSFSEHDREGVAQVYGG